MQQAYNEYSDNKHIPIYSNFRFKSAAQYKKANSAELAFNNTR